MCSGDFICNSCLNHCNLFIKYVHGNGTGIHMQSSSKKIFTVGSYMRSWELTHKQVLRNVYSRCMQSWDSHASRF